MCICECTHTHTHTHKHTHTQDIKGIEKKKENQIMKKLYSLIHYFVLYLEQCQKRLPANKNTVSCLVPLLVFISVMITSWL